MTIFLLLLALVIFHSMTLAPQGQFQKDYISKSTTANIKGIFVILILFSHYTQYVTLGGPYDDAYLALRKHLNQMVVVMFLFYSGFGIMRSIQNKGQAYIRSRLPERFLKVWLQFAAAVLLFLITGLLLGKKFTVGHVLLSFVGWDSIGNSNWYIFDTLAAYLLLFIAFMIFSPLKSKKVPERSAAAVKPKAELSQYLGCGLFTVLIILFVYGMMAAGRSGYWYNTIFLFPVGCWYALFQDKIEKLVMKNDFWYVFFVLANLAVYLFAFERRWSGGIEMYTVWACSFTAMILLFTMKCSVSGNLLSWFGQHVFSVYILQRIPMMVLDRFGLAETHKYAFLILSFLITILMAMLFDGWIGKLWNSLTINCPARCHTAFAAGSRDRRAPGCEKRSLCASFCNSEAEGGTVTKFWNKVRRKN